MHLEKPTQPTPDSEQEPIVTEDPSQLRAGVEPQLAGEAVDAASGMITIPEDVQRSLDEQKAAEAAAQPAPQPLIEMPEHLVPEGYVAPPSPEEVGQAIKNSYVPGPEAIRRHGIEVAPGKFVMPQDLEAYKASQNKDGENQ